MNIIAEVQKVFPNKKLFAFLGGLHMKGKQDGKEISTFSEAEISELVSQLKKTGIKMVYTGHCTGNPAMELLEKYLSDQLKALKTGLVIEI